jgi:transcriptional regulator with XRE-family HTH domain
MDHAGLRKIDLARALDVSPATVTRWVAGTASPTIDNLTRIAGAVGARDDSGEPSLSAFFAYAPAVAGEAGG